tara:strand:+ start:39121 stop:39894 length:774 start_codon:yes stop_codon:yes gene_type:complete
MDDDRTFQEKQYAFAAHIRDPEHTIAPEGIEDRRMAVYRELFFNNLSSLLSKFFPVLRKILSKQEWRATIRQFMVVHRAKTPYFPQLPEEFLAFLQNEYRALDERYPFICELAHYEYAELALRVSPEENSDDGVDASGDLLQDVPVKSILSWTFAYHYPVHRISADFQPVEKPEQPTYLAIYRRDDDKVRFLELNAVTAGLLNAIENNDDKRSGETMLRDLGAQIGYPDIDALVQHGADALQEMRQLQILIGTTSAS